MLGLKRAPKSNPLNKAVFTAPPELMGGIFLYGRIGSGKSTAMFTVAQRYHDHPTRRYKILQLWGGDRTEQMYWCFPSRDIKYWDRVKRLLNLQNDGPKQYKVNILYPVSKNLRHKLPSNEFVKSKVFTIPISSVEVDDITLSIGPVAQTNEYLWREVKNKMKKGQNGAHLLKYFKDLKGTNTILFRNFVKPLVRDRLLQNDYCSYNLDLRSEIRDRETITVLCMDFIDKEFRIFVMGWVLRQLSELIDKGKVHTKNIIMIQEAAEFFRATDDSIMPDRYKIFRRHLAHYVRMGRRGMHMFMDAQSPKETKGMVDGSQDLTIMGRLTSESDKEDATKQLYKDNLMTRKQIQDLSVLNPGEYYIAESGKRVRKRYFFLPRTMYWKKGYGNFYDNTWKKLIDEWRSVKNILDELEEDYQKTKKQLEDAEKVAKAVEEMEKTAEKQEDQRIRKRMRKIDRKETEEKNDLEELHEEFIVNDEVPEPEEKKETVKKRKRNRKNKQKEDEIKIDESAIPDIDDLFNFDGAFD